MDNNQLLQDLLSYIRENIEDKDIERAWNKIDRMRCPLAMADPQLYNDIDHLVEDFIFDNNLDDDWLYDEAGTDIEEIFEQL